MVKIEGGRHTSQPLIPLAILFCALATEKQKELGASTNGFIFSCQDKPLGYGTMRKINEKYCRRAGIEYKSHHKIRKTVASKMLDDGINPDYIRLFLGQEDILTTWGITCTTGGL